MAPLLLFLAKVPEGEMSQTECPRLAFSISTLLRDLPIVTTMMCNRGLRVCCPFIEAVFFSNGVLCLHTPSDRPATQLAESAQSARGRSTAEDVGNQVYSVRNVQRIITVGICGLLGDRHGSS